MKPFIAFFDLDHTLLDTSSGRLFIKYAYQQGMISHGELISGMLIAAIHRFGMFNTSNIFQKWAQKFAGWPETKMRDFTERFFIERVASRFRPQIVDEVRFHKARGAHTVLLSASTSYICEPARRHLSMDAVLSTTLEVENGIFTGRTRGRYCYGAEKLVRAAAYCRSMDIALSECYYYGDSFADLPVLEKIGFPVCVHPDRALRRIALQRGWRTIP